MPIIVKDFSWWQTECKLFLQIQIPHVSQKNADILTSNKYLKISCLPHIFEAILWDEINEEYSKCTFDNGSVLFELQKKNSVHWECLALKKSKEELKKLKCEILNNIIQERQNKSKQKAVLKTERDRLAVKEQIDFENKEHQLIQSIRDEEKEKVLKELSTWKTKTEIIHDEKKDNKNNKDIFSTDEPIKIYEIENEPTECINQLPNPRTFKAIEINFTPRHFTTPSRESTKADEQEWLKKQTAARRAAGFVEEDLRPEEHDPEWCLQKGNTFMTELNYIGAVSAYSHGIKLSPKMAVLYLNRSKAQVQLKNYHKAVEDATTALELLVPAVEGNVVWRAEAYYNRGKALVELNTAHLAIDELRLALTLAPDRAHLYGPELQRAMELAPVHEQALNKSRELDLSNAPTVWCK
ncbi:hypothetical protein AGLY_010979 [Aphis glycines]|uniref:CS domain-containing protein n=1 Tax=Aphis glycines TaxID=307491 RepID=A0A6G0TEC9_APHGL|nr:hypothetical protein AGLY_010979 [Aphis glycines]